MVGLQRQSYIAHKQQDTAAITRHSVVAAAAAAAKKRSHIQNQLMARHIRDTLIPAAVTITQPLFVVRQEYSCQRQLDFKQHITITSAVFVIIIDFDII